jgi:hypothetical protein
VLSKGRNFGRRTILNGNTSWLLLTKCRFVTSNLFPIELFDPSVRKFHNTNLVAQKFCLLVGGLILDWFDYFVLKRQLFLLTRIFNNFKSWRKGNVQWRYQLSSNLRIYPISILVQVISLEIYHVCPKQCCGSESERIRKFWLNLNPKQISDSNSDPETDILCEKSKIKHLKDKNLMFFYWRNLFSNVQVPEHIWKQLEAPFRKFFRKY